MHQLNKEINILISDGEIKYAHYVIRCLSNYPSVKIHVISKYKWIETRFSRHIASFNYYPKTDITHAEQWLKIIEHEINDKHIDVLFPVNVTEIRLLSRFKHKFEKLMPHFLIPPTQAFDIANNKWHLFEFLKENDLSRPFTIHSKTIDNDTASKINFPVLIKPLSNSGGHGIEKVATKKLLNTAINANRSSIIQEYIQGYDIDMSVLCKNGDILAYTIQKGYLFNTEPYGSPHGVEFVENRAIYELVKAVIKKLNWSGFAHIDIRYDEVKQDYKIIEINPRIWGSIELSNCVGANFPYLYCLASLEIGFEVPKYKYEKCVNNTGLIKIIKSKMFRKKVRHQIPKNTILKNNLIDPIPSFYKFFVIKLTSKFNKRMKLFKKLKHDVYCNFDTILK